MHTVLRQTLVQAIGFLHALNYHSYYHALQDTTAQVHAISRILVYTNTVLQTDVVKTTHKSPFTCAIHDSTVAMNINIMHT